MNASNQIKKQKSTTGAQISEQAKHAHAANGQRVIRTDYSSMKVAVDQIRDQVPFEALKDFYGMI